MRGDAIINSHLSDLYDSLLEQNLARLIEPFSCVEVAHIASLIDLPPALVENKLSKMILDKKVCGVLDQSAGTLIIYDAVCHWLCVARMVFSERSLVVSQDEKDGMYEASLDVISNMSDVVDSLFLKVKRLN